MSVHFIWLSLKLLSVMLLLPVELSQVCVCVRVCVHTCVCVLVICQFDAEVISLANGVLRQLMSVLTSP